MYITVDPHDPSRYTCNSGVNRMALDGRRAILDYWYQHSKSLPNGFNSYPMDIHCVFYVINSSGGLRLRHVSGDIYNNSGLPMPDTFGYVAPSYEIKNFVEQAMQSYLNREMTT